MRKTLPERKFILTLLSNWVCLLCRRFFKTYGSPGLMNFLDKDKSQQPPVYQLFVETFLQLKRNFPDKSEEELFAHATKAMNERGFRLTERDSSS
jgi:hypothetical protein